MPIASVAVGDKITASKENAIILEANQLGTRLMIPTSAVNGTVATDGTVTFTTQSSVDILGCFTSDYADYEIDIVITTTSTTLGINLALRDSGGVLSGAVYDYVRVTGNNSAVASASTVAGTAWAVGAGNANGKHDVTLYLSDVTTAAPTFGRTSAVSTPNPITAAATYVDTKGLLYRNNDVGAGLRLTTSTGTVTGRIRIRGKN